MEAFSDFLNTVAKGLSHKAEALLVFGLSAVALLLVWLRVAPAFAFGFPSCLYVLYMWRAERSDRHDERMKNLEIDQIDRDRGARLAQRRRKMLAKKTK